MREAIRGHQSSSRGNQPGRAYRDRDLASVHQEAISPRTEIATSLAPARVERAERQQGELC